MRAGARHQSCLVLLLRKFKEAESVLPKIKTKSYDTHFIMLASHVQYRLMSRAGSTYVHGNPTVSPTMTRILHRRRFIAGTRQSNANLSRYDLHWNKLPVPLSLVSPFLILMNLFIRFFHRHASNRIVLFKLARIYIYIYVYRTNHSYT